MKTGAGIFPLPGTPKFFESFECTTNIIYILYYLSTSVFLYPGIPGAHYPPEGEGNYHHTGGGTLTAQARASTHTHTPRNAPGCTAHPGRPRLP